MQQYTLILINDFVTVRGRENNF